MRNDEDRAWLYDKMQKAGVDTGSYDDFVNSLNNDEDRDWYYQKSQSLGLDVGSADDFYGMMVSTPQSSQPQSESELNGEQEVAKPEPAKPAQPKQEKPKAAAPITTQNIPSVQQMMDNRPQLQPASVGKTEEVEEEAKNEEEPQAAANVEQKGRVVPTTAEVLAMRERMNNIVNRSKATVRNAGKRMDAISKGNKMGDTSEMVFNPETNKWERKYYTTTGEVVDSKEAQSQINMANRDVWEATTEEGQKHRAKRIMNDYEERLGSVLERYDDENTAELAWQEAEEKTRAAQIPNPTGNSTIAAATLFANQVEHMKYHDLKRMADRSWEMLGKEKQQAIVDDIYDAMRPLYPELSDDDVRNEAKKTARQMSDQRLFELAVAKNAPQDATEYFFRKAVASNAYMKVMEALARSSAGTTGDMEARDVAEQIYGKNHKIAGMAGTVTGFAIDPLVWISAGAGSAATRGALWATGKALGTAAGRKFATSVGGKMLVREVGDAAARKFAPTLGGRLLLGAVGGAGNFATFEAGGEALEQARYGGKVILDPETSRYIIGDYDAGEVGKRALHGAALGTATGVIAPMIGNVSDKLVNATKSTAGKLGYRAGELGVSTVAEGTIFSVPEWIEGKEDAMDVWTDNLAMMAAFKLQHGIKSAPRVIGELSADPKGLKSGFETRLRSVLDGQADLALTADEKRELEKGGYGDLKDLTEAYLQYAEAKKNGGKDVYGQDAELPYTRFVQLMRDGSISEAARAKMYYYITGRMLPMSTVMGSSPIEEVVDADGNVTGYEVQSVGANGVITSRTFDSKERAEVEVDKINRQAELNSIDVGERYADTKGENKRLFEACQEVANETGAPEQMLFDLMRREPADEVEAAWAEKVRSVYEGLGEKYSSKEMRDAINEEFGVDVDEAIRKKPNSRNAQEKEAVKEYTERLFYSDKRITGETEGEAPTDPNATTEIQAAKLLDIDDDAPSDPMADAFQRGYEADEQERRDLAVALGAEQEPSAELQEAWKGVVQRINDDADYMAAKDREAAKQRQHVDGTYKPVQLKDGTQAFVVDGKLATTDDGQVDVKHSDNVIVVFDPATGQRKQVNPLSSIDAVYPETSQEWEDATIEANKKAYIQTRTAEAKGVLPFVAGDNYNVVDEEGNPHSVLVMIQPADETPSGQILVSVDGGEPTYMNMSDIQAMADRASLAEVAQRAEEEVVPEPSEQVSNYTEGVPESYENGVEIVVRNEEGKETPAMVMGRMRIEDGLFVPDDNGNIVEYLIDGDVAHDYINDLNEKVVRYNDNRQQTTDNGQGEMVGETGGEASPNTAGANEPPAATNEAPALEPVDENAMPMIGEGEDAEPDFLAVTPQRGHQYLFDEMGINEKAAKGIVEANIKAASKDVEKQAKELDKLDNNPGANVVKYKKTREEIERKAVAAQTALDYWNAVKAEQDKRDAAAQQAAFEAATAEPLDRQAMLDEQKDLAAKIEKAKQMYGDYFDSDFSVPQDVNELVAMNMPSEKISWEGREGVRGLQQELGSNHIRAIGNGSTNGFNTYLAKKGEGISTDKAIHDIWESPMNQLPNGEKRWDTEEIRNAFIDMFRNATKPSDIKDYVYNSRVRQAEEMRAAEDEAIAIAQMDEDIRQRMGMEKEEYDAWIADMVARAEAQAAYENETFNETNIDNDKRTEASTGTEGTGEVQGQEGIGIGTEEDNPASVGRDGAGEDTGRVSAEGKDENGLNEQNSVPELTQSLNDRKHEVSLALDELIRAEKDNANDAANERKAFHDANVKSKEAERALKAELDKMSDEDLARLAGEAKESENITLWNAIRDVQDARELKNSADETFASGIAEQNVESIKHKTKFNPDSFTSKDEIRKTLNGVYHDESGYGVVGDGKILYYDKRLYDKKNKGKVVATHKMNDTAKGEAFEGRYPNWRGVVDSNKPANQVKTDIGALLDFLAGAENKLKEQWQNEKARNRNVGSFAKWLEGATVMLRMPDGSFVKMRYDILKKFAEGAENLGATSIGYTNYTEPLLAESKHGGVLAMPMNVRENGIVPPSDLYYDISGKEQVGKTEDVSMGNVVEFNITTYNDEKEEMKNIFRDGGWEEEQIDEIFSFADQVADEIEQLRKASGLLDAFSGEPANPKREILKSNPDYAGSFDYSYDCVKKEAMNYVIEQMVALGKSSHLGLTQIEAIKKVLEKHGYLTPCVMCYVEGKRKLLKQSKETEQRWNAVADAAGLPQTFIGEPTELTDEQSGILRRLAEGKDIDKVDGGGERIPVAVVKQIASLMLGNDILRGRFDHQWLMTPSGYTNFYDKFSSTGIMGFVTLGQYKGKGLLGITPFSLQSIAPDRLDELFNPVKWAKEGGLRQFSYEDARPIMFFDYFQQMMLLQAAHAPLQLYTKREMMPDLFGETGAMINQSLVVDVWNGSEEHRQMLGLDEKAYDGWLRENAGFIPKGVLDGSGDMETLVPYYSKDSFPIEAAMRNAKDARFGGRVGNAVVAPSDAFIRWALDNPDIHQILAYHAMGTSPVQRALVGYDKATQYDRDYLTGDAHTNVNDVRNGIVVEGGKLKWNTLLRKYQREGKGAREAAQFYLDYCKENGIKPMFEKFADHPEYYKMLVDFRAYDEQGNSVKQKAVKATLPEGWQEKLSGYLGEQEQVTEAVQGIASNEDLQRELQQATKYVSLEPAERETTEKILGEIYGKENIFMLGGEEFDKALDAATEDGKANALRDAGGVVYGFTVGGKIYLSTDLFNAHTPLHEHGHIYMSVLEQIQPKLHQRGIELWKGTDMWEKIRQHLETLGEDTSDSHILSELAAQFTGKENEKVISEMTGITDKNWLQRAMSWLKELWAGVKSAFSKWTGKDLEELTPEQFISMPFRAFYDPEERAKYIKNLRAAREMGMAADMEAPITKNDDAAYKEAVDKGDTEAVKKMVDAAAAKAGYTIKAYHGTSRADRVGNVFRADRATSGPMAFFTDNEEIAESYAKGKNDTSIAYDTDYDSYETQFRSTHKATGKDYAIYDMWGFLPRSAQNEIAEKAKHVRKDWDGDGGIIYDPETTQANGGWDWQVKENRGNILKALDFQWLASGNLWNKEGEYLKVLELSGVNDALEKAGFELPRYMNPDYRDEAVYNVYLKIQNPFDTTTMVDEGFIEGLKKFADEHEDEYRKETASADMWDKNNETVDEFIKRLRDDMKLGESFAWTSIPDVVSAYIKGLGYDGIKDTGGKNGGDIHTVWIPFESEQIKRSAPETYDDEGNLIPLSKRFNKESNDIRFHFVGEKGAAEADRAEGSVARIEGLATAKQMEADGKAALNIKLATGWERGKDGKWRYEIQDDIETADKGIDAILDKARKELSDLEKKADALGQKIYRIEASIPKRITDRYSEEDKAKYAKMREERDKLLKEWNKALREHRKKEDAMRFDGISTTLGEMLGEDNELFKYYPEMKSMPVTIKERLDSAGEYDEGKIMLRMRDGMASTLLHEIQHAIQQKEGFARGGNVSSVLNDDEVNEVFVTEVRNSLNDVEDKLNVVRDAKDSDEAVARYAEERGMSEDDARSYLDSEEARLMLKEREYNHLFEMLGKNNMPFQTAFDYYRRIAGEVEARNVQARAGMTPDERRRTLASETEDILRGEQIVTYGDAGGSASIVEDEKEVARLEAEPKEVGYRNVILNEDGTLGSPMANRLGKTGAGRKATSGFEFNKWERSDEHPELATDKGKIDLIKPDGNTVGSVDYNPYIHIRPTLVNKQFKQAWERPNLVYVRTEYPASELEKGYKAEKAKLSVGKHPWNGGELILSRWDKPIEIVPWEEVADDWVKEFDGKGIPFDIIPPKLLPILAERGIEILPPHKGMGRNCFEAYNQWKAENQPSKLYRKPTFYSNAERAVEDIKQEKATPDQWLAMITKNGGLKAGEDKWMGLSDWLTQRGHAGHGSITKQEVLDFIRSNRVEVEDVNYSENADVDNNERMQQFRNEFDELLAEGSEATNSIFTSDWADWALEEMASRYGDDFRDGFTWEKNAYGHPELVPSYDWDGGISGQARYYLDIEDNPINSTRLDYTTEGLDNKREIALVVPSIESWNEGDDVHFGDAGEGRAIAWVRFGETTDADGKRVLVIDEIQSKRHQEGRERGYKVSKEKADAEMNAFLDRMREKYNYKPQDKFADFFSKDELAELDRLNAQQHAAYFGNSDVPDAPFDKNWHELAMKRMLRYAAENGYDKIAWTKGEQQAERYDIGKEIDYISVREYEAQSPNEVNGFDIDIEPRIGETIQIFSDKEGNISGGDFEGKNLRDVFGKELAAEILSTKGNNSFNTEDLRIGAEGMAGFYDQILPRFMDKYGKKWGVKTEEIELPNVEEAGRTMWSVDVTPEMKESVMQGQPMFRDGAYTPSYEESLAASQAAGYTKKQHDAWWNRMQKNMRKTAEDWAKKMHIADIVDIYDSASDLDGVEGVTDEDKQSKGWFDPSTGRIVVILGNHESVNDVFKTILHEGVNHYGLRKLFGEHFDTFLDNVFANATPEIRKEITQLAKQNGWNFHTATEEYLGKLAEDTDFENAEKSGWWQQIKRWFAEMLRTIWKNGTEYIDKITDNELRYVLWRSYQNLVNPGRYRSLVETAKDVAKQYELGVGKFAPKEEAEELPMAAEPTDQHRMAYALNAIKNYDNTLALFKGSDGFYNSTDRKTLESVAGVTTFSPRMLDEVMGKLIRSGRRVAVIDEFPQAAESGGKLHRADNLQERITEGSIRLAEAHNEDKVLRNNAMRAIGGNLADLRKAMSLQREFDKGTVKRVADLAKILMDNGYLNNMSQYEVGRLLSAVKNSTGKEDISESVQKVMDIMVDNQLKRGEDALHGLESIRGSKVDARGVEVQGSLDVQGQQIVKAFKDSRRLNEGELEEAIANAQERMGSSDAAVAEEAANEYTGLQYAMDYLHNIHDSKTEERELREEIKNYDGAPEGKKEFVRSIEDAIRQNKIERAQAYFDLVGRMAGGMRESMENAKAFKEAEVERVREIQHNANSDMEGRPSKEHYQPKVMDKFVNNSFVQALFSPLSTFDQMLRMLGSKSANGEGYLYNRFMRGWVDARQNEIKGVRSKYAILDDKAKEIFGGNVKSMGDLIREVGKLPKATVSFWNGGEMEEHELTQGNLMYIYMVDKMLDGRMKLRRMGIKEEDVANITKALDPRLIEFADWMQDEFLVETRNEYNETHKRLFGAPMAAVENYFPLKILANARADKAEDLDNPVMNEGISTKTGSIIKRRRNGLALDILNADALNVVLDHVAKMEHWNAFAEFNRDLNTLRTYKHFRNQVYNMTSIYGSGDVLWQRFNDLSQMAAGTYRPKRAKFDEYAVNIAKGVTAAKVSFRLFTALKQFLSSPAYLSEARPDFLAKNIAMPWKAWDWSMEHLPIFEERWKSKFAGDPRLMKTELDWAGWRNNVVQIASRIGMSPNAFVDALTVSIGAHSIYETRKARYKFLGFSEEQAEKRAIQDAEIAYNQTQQSSEGAFLSPMQVDRTWASVMFTVFRNSSMAYQRQLHDALRNSKRNLNPSQREASIEFMTKQLVRAGIDEEKARKSAESMYNRQLGRDAVRIAVFGFIMQLAWNIGGYLPYLLFGDDDDEKDKMWDDILTHSAFGSVEGLTGGDVLSRAGQMMLTGEGNPEYLVKDMPLASDAKDILREMGSGKTSEALTDMINLIVQAGIGVNPQSITDAALAIMDVCGGDEKLANEATIFIARVLQVPQSQIDKMYFDEINMYGSEAKHLSAEELAKRYAAYKQKRANFFAPWKWDDEKAIEKQTKKAYDLMKERLKEKEDSVLYDAVRSSDKELSKQATDILGERIKEEDDSTLAQVFDDTYGTGLQKVAANEIAKRMGGTDSYGKSKADYDVLYKKYRSYVDLAEDITLLNKLNEAKKSGDKRLAKGIGKYREEIAKVKRGLTGILENDDERMGRIRELRRKALDFAEENDSKE